MSLTPVQQTAYDNIQKSLSSGFLNPVSHDDVNAAAGELKNLSAADANAVIAEMRRTGQLDRLASEGVDGAWFGNGGYSAEERRDLFNNLAGKLDGANLAAVSNAFENAGGGEDGYNLAKEFASSVASHASPTAKVDYIKTLSGETVDGTGFNGADIFGGGSWSRDVDGDAAAVATVLGSLRGAQAQEAFSHLAQNPDQLNAVLETGIDQSARYSRGGSVISFDTAGFRGVMDAAASISDPDLKARIFDAGTAQLRTIRDTPGAGNIGAQSIDRNEALAEVRDGLTKLIDSDTTGIVHELEVNAETRSGSGLAAYAKEMFEAGQTDKLAEQMAKLQFGNDLQNAQDPVARLNETSIASDGTERRHNAAALGYFVGAAYAATDSKGKDVAKEQANVTAFLKSLGVIVAPGAGKVGGVAIGVAREWVFAAVNGAINNPGAGPAQRLEDAALPTVASDPAKPYDREIAVGDPAEGAFGAAVDHVRRNARP